MAAIHDQMPPHAARKCLLALATARKNLKSATGRHATRLQTIIAKYEKHEAFLKRRAAEKAFSSFLKNDKRKK